MSMDPSISVVWEAPDGTLLDLTTTLVDFERIRLREEKKVKVVIHNQSGEIVDNIEITAVAHPTAQIGRAQDTYDVMDFSETEFGTYINILQIALMSVDEKKDIWLRWTMPESAIPGWGQFAIKVIGDVRI